MADHRKRSDVPGLPLTPRLLSVGAFTLAGWLWFYFHGEPLDAAATVVLTVAVLLFVELVRAVYARIRRALTVKHQRRETDRRRRRAQER